MADPRPLSAALSRPPTFCCFCQSSICLSFASCIAILSFVVVFVLQSGVLLWVLVGGGFGGRAAIANAVRRGFAEAGGQTGGKSWGAPRHLTRAPGLDAWRRNAPHVQKRPHGPPAFVLLFRPPPHGFAIYPAPICTIFGLLHTHRTRWQRFQGQLSTQRRTWLSGRRILDGCTTRCCSTTLVPAPTASPP